MTEHGPNGEDTPMPDDPQVRPEQTTDAIEERITGRAQHQQRDEESSDQPAFEQDVDPSEATGEEGGHIAGESPG